MAVVIASGAIVAALPEIHRGNVGSFLEGLAAVVLAGFAIVGGFATLPELGAKLRRQRELAEEQTTEIRLNRRRILEGWSSTGVPVYGVRLVTDTRRDDAGRHGTERPRAERIRAAASGPGRQRREQST
jgi:hypothetical protein